GTDDGSAADDDSDNGPYCLCRGPDDHRWMICCEGCDDWFHGECINLSKEVGENLIEKFICPRCTTKQFRSIYKKSCSMGACKKAARLGQTPPSYFCSNDHAQAWWERLVGRLPKTGKGGSSLTDQLSQDEFMALLSSGLATVDEHGNWAMKASPFAAGGEKGIANGTSRFRLDISALALGIRHQIREMAAQSEVEEAEERIVREAAAERWRRKQSERNWVEVIGE
ncbi:hypothetical protein LLEC1_07997, partial [Akanthomyces lecanii]